MHTHILHQNEHDDFFNKKNGNEKYQTFFLIIYKSKD